jgi:hypothetical protein
LFERNAVTQPLILNQQHEDPGFVRPVIRPAGEACRSVPDETRAAKPPIFGIVPPSAQRDPRAGKSGTVGATRRSPASWPWTKFSLRASCGSPLQPLLHEPS